MPQTVQSSPESGYARDEVSRMLAVSDRQLRAWQKQGLVPMTEVFGFSDLLALKTLKKLRDLRVAPVKIRRAMASLRRMAGEVDQPLSQLRITVEGRHLTVHVSGDKMEPITGQLLFDFDAKEIEKLRSFPTRTYSGDTLAEGKEQEAEFWFQRGLALEEVGSPPAEAAEAYRKAIDINPRASGALVNLGTISFRMRKLAEAESYYLRAVNADPDYPLAHFNLGNLFDEQGRVEEARNYYLAAIRLNPRYADAHFNLALLCERNNEILRAIGCWQTYLKLDSTSSWARAARKQLEKLKRTVRSK